MRVAKASTVALLAWFILVFGVASHEAAYFAWAGQGRAG